MPNRNSKTNSAKRIMLATPRRYWIPTTIAVVSLLVIATAVGLRIHRERAIAADKARFQQAEQEVNELSKQIIAAAGEPANVTSEKFCSRPSMKWEDGPLSCKISHTFFYTEVDDTSATNRFRTIQNNVNHGWKIKRTKYSDNIAGKKAFLPLATTDYSAQIDYQEIYEDYLLSNLKMDCSAIFDYYKSSDPPFANYLQSSDSQTTLGINLACGDYAKSQYYPLNH